MINEVLIASNNPDKLEELKALLAGLPLNLHSLGEFPLLPPTVEDQDSIAGNAMKKALEAAKHSGLLAVADDTGLFIEALDGQPGVYAARFAGEGCSYADNRNQAIAMLRGISNRKASFKTAMALAAPEGILAVVEGCIEGNITDSERGDSGFGYDSIFEINGVTYAEMDSITKNQISHRAKAMEAMVPILKSIVNMDL
jgi:XTP/dITP diphosphohydrolase